MECEAFVRFKAIKDGEYLTVKAINLQHNHPVNVVSNHVGLGVTENVPCDNCTKSQCDYCGDIAVEYLLQ